ncbi:helix-turn-helix domain-containing protein [Histidinibacterium lentulum]|uniref:Helix-turn-helix domain-containing protein n=1 Tax=Histidinibacterium lentulum TaxID=2480588 RepID=A0A3N2RAM8_9RHOB|nr:helix-turn-helix domain-containing protein [Histidinibacterium lentulum]
MPGWVPDAVGHYLAHVDGGIPIRALARRIDVHASTVLRQIRRIEARRDDPLVDGGLRRLARALGDNSWDSLGIADGDLLDGELIRVLRRLCEAGATLALAREMERAVVVRDASDGEPARTAMVERPTAEVLALRDLVECEDLDARILRYRVTGAGRSELRMRMAARENAAQERTQAGLAEARRRAQTGGAVRARHPFAESPLASLARRRDKDGTPFLGKGLVAAGERLREDFELAQLEAETPPEWLKLVRGETVVLLPDRGHGQARARVASALGALGPGLGDVALRCCCLLEGMEETERRMGWSARSGKIVLRIALQRLRTHYDSQPAHRIG